MIQCKYCQSENVIKYGLLFNLAWWCYNPLKVWWKELKGNMATQHKSPWNDYDFIVKPYEYWRRVARFPGNYLFYGTGQLVALSLYAKPLNKHARTMTAKVHWYIQNLGTEEVIGSGSFVREMSPKRKFKPVKMITNKVIDFPDKYIVKLELSEQEGTRQISERYFNFSVVERVDYQMNLLTLFAVTISILALIAAIVAICFGVS